MGYLRYAAPVFVVAMLVLPARAVTAVVAVNWAASAAGASPGTDSGGGVTGTGRVTITRRADVLRAEFVVTARAKDVAGAVAKLKESQSVATRKLKELGASEKSIEAGPTRQGAGAPDARTQYVQYIQEMQQAALQSGGVPKRPTKPRFVTISSTLKAEWPIAATKDDDALFIAGTLLQDKIRAAGIGKPEAKKQAVEGADDAEDEADSQGSVAEPTFLYIGKVPEAERAAAKTEAFQKAKKDAADIAKAAGAELAGLRGLSCVVSSPTAAADGTDQGFMKALMQQMSASTALAAAEAPTDEASASSPIPVSLQITITASFDVK